MTWDLKRRESLTDYNFKRFQIKMVSNLTSGDQIGWFSIFFFFSFLPPSFFFRDFEYQFVGLVGEDGLGQHWVAGMPHLHQFHGSQW